MKKKKKKKEATGVFLAENKEGKKGSEESNDVERIWS